MVLHYLSQSHKNTTPQYINLTMNIGIARVVLSIMRNNMRNFKWSGGSSMTDEHVNNVNACNRYNI